MFIDSTHFGETCSFWGRKKTPVAAAGHDPSFLRTKAFLASMAHERTDQTSRRAEIPPPEQAALRAAPQRGAALRAASSCGGISALRLV